MNETQRNRLIEQELAKEAAEQSQIVKLLLLGAGDSGKTTLRKQARNLFGSGFSTEMKMQFAPVILSLLTEGFETVVAAMHDQLKLEFVNPETTDAVAIILQHKGGALLNENVVQAMKKVQADPSFAQTLARRNEYQLQDCWMSFADQARTFPAWGGPGWVPSVDDCVACRVRTTGIQEEDFALDNIPFKIFDVGGQRAERRKWIHCFDNVTALIFMAAISEYDQVLFEDRKKNRLEEALDLFEEVINMRVFEQLDIILFLNKTDLFEKKFIVQGIPLDPVKFPGAPVGDVNAAYTFIEQLFLSRNTKKKKIHVHMTAATDSDNIKKVFDACKNIILQASMTDSGTFRTT